MRLSRSFAVSMFLGAALSLAACGGSDGKGGPDAAGGDDAPVTPDAPPVIAPATGLGAVCDNTTPCPTTGGTPSTATQCTALTQGATHGFCTFECAVTATTAQPAAADQQKCATATPAPGQGTPACVIYQDTGTPAMRHWSCAIGCGTVNGQNLGGCPAGLTCDMTNHLCL